MVSSPAIVRRGCKCRILEMHLKWSDQQLKTIMDTCRLLYWNFMATTNQKSTIDTHTQKEKESKHNTKYSHQITRGQNKKGREEARITKTIPKQLTKWQNMVRTCMSAKSLQLCPTLCNTMGCSLPSSSAHGILQARILEWVAMLSSRGSSQARDWTSVSYISCTGRQVLYHYRHLGSMLLLPSRFSRIWLCASP